MKGKISPLIYSTIVSTHILQYTMYLARSGTLKNSRTKLASTFSHHSCLPPTIVSSSTMYSSFLYMQNSGSRGRGLVVLLLLILLLVRVWMCMSSSFFCFVCWELLDLRMERVVGGRKTTSFQNNPILTILATAYNIKFANVSEATM